MALETLIIITAVVAALGTVSAHYFRSSTSPYLLTVSGTRPQLIACGALIWGAAIAAGLVGLIIVSAVASGVVAVAIFFGIEAVALDICAHRIRYERTREPRLIEVRVTALQRQ
jgi:hypothetical protein